VIALFLSATLVATPGCDPDAGPKAELLSGRDRARSPDEQTALETGRAKAACQLASLTAPAAEVDRGRLSAIYVRPEFKRARDRQNVAAELLGRLLYWLFSLIALSTAERFTLGARVVVFGLAVLVVILAALRLRSARLRRGGATGAAPSAALVLDDPRVHLDAAAAALAADPREAIRQGLLALLSVLERRRWARPDRVRTNRELASELPRRGAPPEVTQRVERLVQWFDRTFYSLDPVPAAGARSFLDDIAGLRAQVEAAPSR
jgi:hypothetical protein